MIDHLALANPAPYTGEGRTQAPLVRAHDKRQSADRHCCPTSSVLHDLLPRFGGLDVGDILIGVSIDMTWLSPTGRTYCA
jgi:hypothetical protein